MLQHVCRTVRVGVALLTAVLLQVSCVTGEGESTPPPTMLSIYVFSPDKPVVTRADDVYVSASDDEARVHSLHIWVFENSSETTNGSLVAYYYAPLTDDDALNGGERSDVFQVPVSDEFIARSPRPNVDIYVLANVTAADYDLTLNESTTLDYLKNTAKIANKFGLEDHQAIVPSVGLPMSGVLLNQPVVGDAPVLSIGGTDASMAQVKLGHAVSKLRFVFGAQEGNTLHIKGVSVNSVMLPEQEYFFLEGTEGSADYRVGSSYNGSEVKLWEAASGASGLKVITCKDPTVYASDSHESTAFENYEVFINDGIAKEELTPLDPQQFYLRESDKQMSGKIYYTVDDGDTKSVSFTMSAAGDFSRNHIWIVYAYYDSLKLQVASFVVKSAFKKWEDGGTGTHTVHNW